jgi:metallo-beta-lactamase class B
MFARLLAAILPAAMQINPVTIPFGKPPPHPIAPIAPLEVAGPSWAEACKGSDDWTRPAPPVRIHANTYLVGTCGISSILIVGDAGDILIDGGPEDAADLIANNIRVLGFRPRDVKIILNSHEHFDHAGGIARLQQLTGAQVYASPAQAKALRSGATAADDPQSGTLKPFPPARVDHIVEDGEMVRLGNLALIATATPGHTSGAISWHWGDCDGGVCRQIVYADSLSPVSADSYRFSDHPAVVANFRKSIAKVAALDCDILLTPHPSASAMPERLGLQRPMEDPGACRDYATGLTKRLDDRLAKEAASK